jgi:hypothetical protein
MKLLDLGWRRGGRCLWICMLDIVIFLFSKTHRVSTLSVWGEWCPSLKKILWVIRKKEPLSRWLACPTFPFSINICLDYPTSYFICKKCFNICEVDVSSLGFKVNSRLGDYISWFYIDYSFFCCCNYSTWACKIVFFYSIWCWALVVLRHELGQVKGFFLCSFYGDQIQVALHLLNYNYIDYKICASCAKFEKFHAKFHF